MFFYILHSLLILTYYASVPYFLKRQKQIDDAASAFEAALVIKRDYSTISWTLKRYVTEKVHVVFTLIIIIIPLFVPSEG